MNQTGIPDTPAEIFAGMPGAFRPEVARDLKATFQFELTGEEGGTWSLSMADGQCTMKEGVSDTPDVTLVMDASDYVAMIKGDLNAIAAFMAGKIKLTGDVRLAMRLPDLFQRPG
jgi:putative sterol carrier protein